MKRVTIIAAMASEIAPLVKGWQKQSSPKGVAHFVTQRDGLELHAIAAGMGDVGARKAFAVASASGNPDLIVNIGLAGALRVEMKPAEVVLAAQVIDSRTGERFSIAGAEGKTAIVTSARVADCSEKHRLAEAYPNAVAVEMEASILARLAELNEIAFVTVKSISDEMDVALPDLNPYIGTDGQFQVLRYALSLVLQPKMWRTMIRFGENSSNAAKTLAKAVNGLLADYAESGRVQIHYDSAL